MTNPVIVAPLKEAQVIVLSLAPLTPGFPYTDLHINETCCVAVVAYPTFCISNMTSLLVNDETANIRGAEDIVAPAV